MAPNNLLGGNQTTETRGTPLKLDMTSWKIIHFPSGDTSLFIWLVVFSHPSEKICLSNWIISPIFGVKITNISNHHLVYDYLPKKSTIHGSVNIPHSSPWILGFHIASSSWLFLPSKKTLQSSPKMQPDSGKHRSRLALVATDENGVCASHSILTGQGIFTHPWMVDFFNGKSR